MSISIASIASIIPSVEDNTQQYYGLTNASGIPSSTLNNAAARTKSETEIQMLDSEKRNVLWDADADVLLAPGTEDAEGEADPDYSQSLATAVLGGGERDKPIGYRKEDGSVEPYVSPIPAIREVITTKSKKASDRDVVYHSQTSSRIVSFHPYHFVLGVILSSPASNMSLLHLTPA